VDAGPPKPGPGAPEKLRRRDPALIRQHFDVGQVGRIVHGHVHELPSRSAMLSRAQEARVREILGNEPAGDHADVLPGASSHRRTCPRRPSRGSRGLRPETPRARGLSGSVWWHLWFGRARAGTAADLGPVESVPPGSLSCFVTATRDETAASLDPVLVRAGRSGSGRRPALPNGVALTWHLAWTEDSSSSLLS